MLSILIPTYNYDITKLVGDLHAQAKALGIDFEIVVAEDGSQKFLENNKSIKKILLVQYFVLKVNIGRSAIRNYLADKAKGDFLLFLDCDAEVSNNDFLKNYLPFCKENCVVVGGVAYDKNENNQNFSLRLKYGQKREAVIQHFTTFNFLIFKDLFQQIRFDETLKTYGYEDTLFGHQLNKKNIKICYIDNVLIHKGLDDNFLYLQKTEIALKNLLNLYNSSKYPFLSIDFKILRFYLIFKKFHLIPFVKIFFKIFKKLIVKNLTSKKPSLFLFDLYKLGCLCEISEK